MIVFYEMIIWAAHCWQSTQSNGTNSTQVCFFSMRLNIQHISCGFHFLRVALACENREHISHLSLSNFLQSQSLLWRRKLLCLLKFRSTVNKPTSHKDTIVILFSFYSWVKENILLSCQNCRQVGTFYFFKGKMK